MNKYMIVFRRGEVSHSIAPLEANDIAHAIDEAIQMMSEVYGEQIEKSLGYGFEWTMQDICKVVLMDKNNWAFSMWSSDNKQLFK